ncbi:threonine aldolase family protein [Butyricicoccus faecihominis]|uniref:threonine aldolase family protein n=1 Tax=Butyricicoccaceae TaxID=3085642 RepID=UPI0024784F15|nr:MULTISPECIES: threonine aldolase family protein [Butyricicoccaceae]MCQ5129373.1 threonine aldolase family protein [Butyricicoccus faecihominis]WNX85137.1 threonine aldolase family protein [Agathobaculum sp. NTUH-O15-33]
MREIDLRSDTVTLPTQSMRDAMVHAAVGDDVFDDDPTVKELEEYAAGLFGKEAALFVTSGTQGNACALMAQTRRGDCVVLAPTSHIAAHEAGSYAQLAGVSPRFPESANGVMDPASLRACLTDDSDLQIARAGLVVLENAHSTGTVVPLDNMRAVYETANEKGVPVHLDGARLYNAAAYLGITDARELTRYCDTVMCCLSKGLCAPVGSILAGPRETILRAKKVRKLLGGGMRQAGFLAAAGKLALSEMAHRLHEDHENAHYLGELLAAIPGVSVFHERIQTDMVFFSADWNAEKAARYPAFMLSQNIKVTGLMDGEYRMVTHYGVTAEDIGAVAAAVRAFASEG